MSDSAVLSRPIDLPRLPIHPVEIVATDAERAKLAAAYDLQAVNDFRATLEVSSGPGGAISLKGRVVADIVQTCVVSLVPVPASVDEEFALRFVREDDIAASGKPGREVLIDPESADPPEIIEGNTIDAGAVVEEAFVLAIDPYPRAPEASLPEGHGASSQPGSDSPFAVLAELGKPEPPGR
jgi:uncharacterized metal-binding protein YceD (DUF177 family)